MNTGPLHIIFVGMIISFFVTTAALGMMTQDSSVEAAMSQLSIKSDPEQEILKLPDKETYWDHARLRFFMRGDKNKYIAMFKKAVEEKNAVLQVALTNAYAASMWDHDAGKDFSVFDQKNYKNFIFSLRGYSRYISLYREAFGKSAPNLIERERIGEKIYKQAAAEGFVPAMLAKVMTDGSRAEHTDSYEHVHKRNLEILSKLAASKNPEAMLLYGKMLFWDKGRNPKERFNGLKLMHASGFLQVKYPKTNETCDSVAERFKRFCEYYIKKVDYSRWCDYGGMRFFISNVVLEPYQGYLKEFFLGTLIAKL